MWRTTYAKAGPKTVAVACSSPWRQVIHVLNLAPPQSIIAAGCLTVLTGNCELVVNQRLRIAISGPLLDRLTAMLMTIMDPRGRNSQPGFLLSG